MKKIFKIFLVFLIAINFLFSNTVKTKAASPQYSRWWVEYIFDDGTKHQSDWIEEGHSWGYSMSSSVGNSLKLIRKIRLYFDIGNFYGDEQLHFEFSATFGGINPNLLGTAHYFVVGGTWQEIYPTILYEQGTLSPFEHKEIIEYQNNTTNIYQRLIVEFNLIETSNISYVLATVNSSMKKSYTDSFLNEDTNEKVGGILETVKGIFTGITQLPSNIANSVSGFFDNVVNSVMNIGNMITNGLTTLGNFIIDGLKSLFIPSDTYFKNYFDSLYDFFSDKLGILIMPIDILGSLMDNILNLGNGDGFIHIPNIKFMDKTLIPKTDYNLKQDVQQVMGNYYDMYYLLTDVIIYFMLFNMAKKKFDEIVRGTN